MLEVHLLASFKELRLIQSERNSEAALWLKYRYPDGVIKNFQFLVQQTGKLCDVKIVIGDGNREEMSVLPASQSLELSRNLQDL